MALPETIPVRYTEEEAEYLSVRPVVRQIFRAGQLLDMVLRVTGKDAARVRQILRAGTIVFHSYRYWWTGFEAGEEELRAALAAFPDADPARAFRAAECTMVLVESGGGPALRMVEVSRAEASQKRLFARRTFWESLAALAGESPPGYVEYSYERQGDVYALPLAPAQVHTLVGAARRTARRDLRSRLAGLASGSRLLFVCPRV